jgi:hypothetical protein
MFGSPFSLVHQPHSYDRLHITKDTWTKLAAHYNVFPPFFLETVCAFGIKIQDDGNAWNNFHLRQSGVERKFVHSHTMSFFLLLVVKEDSLRIVETCYTVRYFEKNNKSSPSADPWSLRQTGIYHQLNVETHKSTWILIKPSLRFKERLPEKLHAIWYHHESRPIRHILLHVTILVFSLNGWRDYITTQRLRIEQFVS